MSNKIKRSQRSEEIYWIFVVVWPAAKKFNDKHFFVDQTCHSFIIRGRCKSIQDILSEKKIKIEEKPIMRRDLEESEEDFFRGKGKLLQPTPVGINLTMLATPATLLPHRQIPRDLLQAICSSNDALF
jgi:hypothetical protein